MNEDVRIVHAVDIFRQSRRFEMPVKISYARAFANGDAKALADAEQAYLEMIRVANDYFENVPRKNTPDDFINAFRSLILSMKERGFDPTHTLHIDVFGETANGQHRIATAVALGLDVPVCDDPDHTGGRLTYIRFRERGLPEKVAHYAIRQYLRLNDRARTIPRWSKVPDGAIVWYRGRGVTVIAFPKGVPDGFTQTWEEAQEIVNRKFPDKGFPNWRRRANLMRLLEPWRKLQILRYKILLKFRKGKKLEKAKFHIFELGLRQRGYDLLADFIENHRVRQI